MKYHDISLSLAQALVRSHAEAGRGASPEGRPSGPPPFSIAISREAGALGNSVANEVGRRLEWPVYDRNILEKIAEELRKPASRLEQVDERPKDLLGEYLACLFDKYHVGADSYLRHLFASVRGLGELGKCVIVGRGANFILPPETTLRVRLVAQPEDRVREMARRLGLSTAEAQAWVTKTERERSAFVRRVFKADVSDAHNYDLLLNMSRLGVEEAAEIITDTLRRFQRKQSAHVPGAASRELAPAVH